MNNVEFLSFTPTPQEKSLGIATIRVEKRFIFRFKIQQNPKGEGYFSNAPSVKIEENYYPAFQMDSSYEADEIKKLVLSHIKAYYNTSQAPTSQSQPDPLTFNQNEQEQFNFDQPPF